MKPLASNIFKEGRTLGALKACLRGRQVRPLLGNKGFTLVELLVVISIISTLASTVLAALNDARVKAKHATVLGLMTQYRNAIMFAYDTNEGYPDPGNILNTYCLGDYSDNGCGWKNTTLGTGWTAQENINIQNAVRPYMPSLPGLVPETSLYMGSWLWDFRGPTYKCDNRIGGLCTRATMSWLEKEPGQTCLNGQIASGPGFSICTLSFD